MKSRRRIAYWKWVGGNFARSLPDVRFGSFATGSSQQQVGPCPLCPDSDQILHLAEMTLWASMRHRARSEPCL